MRITAISLQRLRLPLDPPFLAAWDPVPRTSFEATIVRVQTDAGLVINPVTPTALRFAPSLLVSDDEIDEALGILTEVLG